MRQQLKLYVLALSFLLAVTSQATGQQLDTLTTPAPAARPAVTAPASTPPAATAADTSTAGPADVYQSSLDGKMYEVRARGDLGLDLYSNDRLVATMNRKKVGDDFKGDTTVLATQCPQNSGKIETQDVQPNRIRMRVEVPSRIISNTMACHVLVLSKWQQFDLIKH